MACETCGESEVYTFPDGFAYAGALWKCPACGCCFAGFDTPAWGLIPSEGKWITQEQWWKEHPPLTENRIAIAGFAEFEKRIANSPENTSK